MFPVDPRQIAGSVRDFVEFRGFFLCASAYAPNSILKCFKKSMVVPVMSVRGEIVQDIPLLTGTALIQKTAFSNFICHSFFLTCLSAAVVLRVTPSSLKASRTTSKWLSMYNVIIKFFYLCIHFLCYGRILTR